MSKLWVKKGAVEGTTEGPRGPCFGRHDRRRRLRREVI